MQINPEWNFEEALQNINDRYPPWGHVGPQLRNRQIEAWGQLVGCNKAIALFDLAVKQNGSLSALGRNYHVSVGTLRSLRGFFEGLPAVEDLDEVNSNDKTRYYSCFISYSSRDQEFAERLHDDLQNNGVQCWFAPEDMKIGDQIRPRIDQEIRLRDKLLVILSENSVKSEWVGDEVEGALEEENKSSRLILFPIRLDDTVMTARDDWAAKIKRRRHIGNFSNWRDEGSYQKAFERLLRDLKAMDDKPMVEAE